MFGAGRRIKLFAPKANSLTASVAVPAQCRAFALESEVVYGKIHRKEHRHPTLPLSVMCHFAHVALEENHAGPASYAEPTASANRTKFWHNLTLLRLHFTNPFLSCCVQKTGSLPRLESVACFLYGHVVFAFMVPPVVQAVCSLIQ